MKKGGFLRNVLDTIRSNQAGGHTGRGGSGGPGSDRATEFGGQLKPSHFSLAQVARHGFPEHPTALAFDPVQKIAAIGTKSGALRIFGRPGVDVWAQHEPAFAITYIRFIVNQGALITVTSDDSIHLWSLRGPNLKLQFSSSGQGMGSSSSPGAAGGPSPAPTGSSNLSSMSPQSGMSTNTSGLGGGTGASSTSNSLLDKVTDTVTGAVDSASDFLSGGGGASSSSDLTASPPGATSEPKQIGSRKPEILHTLKFQREHITCLHQTLMSKWLYIGTERGNVHVANVETFELSGYSIAWNKAIELSRKTHPGAIIHISECPQDTNKLLIGYESGCIVLWDLKQRNADGRYYQAENLLWLAWHYEGKQFVAAHGDGSLITWQTRSNAKPASILYPHAKTAPGGADVYGDLGGQQSRPQQPMAMFLGPSFNNELYRPINKVIWNTSKSTNEQFLLFSGGLPYDGFGDRSQQQQQQHQLAQQEPQTMQHHIPGLVSASPPPSRQSVGGASPARFGSSSSQQQFLKAGSPASPSPMSPSVSHQHHHHQNNQKVLRSTSLTVMLGKSITVLEMDDTIVDFMTICDNSPYENDASDPYAVIVLLSNELILIDLTSSGYPSFDSPYPSASLNESPVTCVQYLADCSSDLIPFLYSTSQNVISRAPKKGFSDKEWPINGGEWGQSLQSYPELVLTGHADGTIKFWDMSGINFDLISKIKTSKLFERPNKPPNAIFIATNQRSSPPGTAHGGGGGGGGLGSGAAAAAAAAHLKRPASNSTPMAPNVPQGSISPNKSGGPGEDHHYNPQSNPTMPNATIDNISELEIQSAAIEENFFAIEKIEFCPTTRHLLVAGAFSQIIQFKLNKKDTHSGGGGAAAASELTTILVEPTPAAGGNSQLSEQVAGPNNQPGSSLAGKGASKQHLLFRVKDHQPAGTAGGSSSGGSSSSTGSHRVRLSGFQPELICLTPLLVSPIAAATTTTTTSHTSDVASGNVDSNITASTASLVYCCQVPPKITALALQETHNILAYAHENGVVLVDIVQKCVIMNAALSDLYGGGGGSVMSNNRDISIQPFATSAILQHHYQSTCSPSPLAGSAEFGFNNKLGTDGPGGVANSSGEPGGADNDASMAADSDLSAMFSKTGAPNGQASPSPAQASANSSSSAAANSSRPSSSSSSSAVAAASQPGQPVQSRYTTNSMFQRQLSTNALNSSCSSKAAAFNANNNVNGKMSGGSNAPATSGGPATGAAAKTGPRLFQRQMTASQLFGAGSGGGSSASGGQLLDSKQRAAALLASVRADPSLANSAACLAGSNFNNNNGQQPPATTTGGPSRSPRATEVNNEQTGKKATKNKRIISRMLSISAIHTTVGGGGGGGGGASSACESSQDDAMQLNESTSGGGGAGGGHNSASSAFDQVASQTGGAADKFDSSFTRSRSSSTSSTTPLNESHLGNPTNNNNNNSAAASESIQCIAFLDPLSGSSGTSGGGGGGGPNHKSLCSIDAQSPVSGQLALWLGTSTGAVLLVNLTMPDNEDNRVLQLQSINAEPIPQASVKLPGQMLQIMPFTCEARPSSQSSVGGNASQSSSLEGDSHGLQSPGLSSSSTGGASGASQATSSGIGTSASQLSAHDHHSSGMSSFESRTGMFLALVSEKQARVYQIPANWSQQTPATPASDHHVGHQHQHHHQTHQHSTTDPPMGRLLINKSNLFAKCDLSDTSYACRSSHVQMRTPDECCLVSYLATGNIVVHALPRLRPVLMEADFVAYTSARIGQSMRFSRQGHCLYQPSAGEIAKFTVSSQYKALVNEMTGALYVPREMPEVPRANFFKSLFSVSQSARQSDRDELFAESGKPSRAVAKHVGASGSSSTSGGGGGIEKLKGAAVGTMGHDMRVAREGLDERGERLGQIEDQTLNMLNSSESYAQAAHQLAQKFKDKKWYQF